MSLIFYHAPMSTAVCTHCVLEELAVPYERVSVDLAARAQDKPQYRALNPNGKVPLIVHDGAPIFESVAIAIYLGETFGVQKRLFPEPGPRRGLALKWLVWCGVSLGGALSRYVHNTSPQIAAEQRHQPAAELARREVGTCLSILDAELAHESYLLGDAFSLVDAHLACCVDYARLCGFDTSAWPRLRAWLERCTARPSFAALGAG
jgi:glutathione S-transferase